MTRPAVPGLVLLLLLAAAAVPVPGASASAAGSPAAVGPAALADTGQRTDAAALAGPAGGAAAGPGTTVDPTLGRASRSPGIEGGLQDQEFDRSEFHITVYANGSARWTFIYRKNLENETEVEEFEAFAEEFNTNETDLYRNFQDRAVDLARQGTNATDRQMAASNFSRQATTRTQPSGSQGEVRMSFLWTNFARTSDSEVVVSDVFEGGLYLGPNQVMSFHRGPDLRFQEAQPPPDENESTAVEESQWIRYRGERNFDSYRPEVSLTSSDGIGSDGSSGDGIDTPGPTGGFGILPWAVLALIVLLGLGAGAAYRSGALATSGSDGGGTTATAADDGESGVAATEPAVSDEELLSDEDRVLQLLDEHGGRMKQVNIVEETGWSKSKVSMLLSDMEEEDQISKLRVGRENIISLKGEEPDAAGSPFEDGE